MATTSSTTKQSAPKAATTAPAKSKTSASASASKTTKKVAAPASKKTKSEPIDAEIAVKQAEKATKSKAKPVASTTLAPQAIWPFPIGPKP